MLTTERPTSRASGAGAPRPTRATSGGNGKAGKPVKMGRQPGLDGIRTFSVGLVAIHHSELVHLWAEQAGFKVGHHREILTGGFVYPEMFFVMSGFLITTIMLQERESTGRFSLKGFYARRGRRLLPGLWVMMATAVIWATFWGKFSFADGRSGRVQLGEMRWSTLWTFLMGQNWYMIFSGQGYFGGFPNLFRHIWSLSIDEQFYIAFPLVLALLFGAGRRFDLRKLIWFCVPLILLGWTVMSLKYDSSSYGVNYVYLSTITRMPGILVGVVLACVWQPWKWPNAAKGGHRGWLDVIGLGSFAIILLISVTAKNEQWYVYRILFPMVTLMAAAVAAMVVHPGARYTRAFFGNKVISGIGQRAFGIYLWHWPIFAGPLATKPYGQKLLIGLPATAVMAELSYRFLETPFRERAIGKWREKVRAATGYARQQLVRPIAIASCGCLFLVGTLAIRLATADEVSLTGEGIDDTAQDAGDTATTTTIATTDDSTVTTEGQGSDTSVSPGDSTVPDHTDAPAATGTTGPRSGKIRLAIVGSSQAVVLAQNLPSSAKQLFSVTKGGKNGCTVFSDGTIKAHELEDDGSVDEDGKTLNWSFKEACKDWLKAWKTSITGFSGGKKAEIALVVTGGWEVFDLHFGSEVMAFGSPQFDQYYMDNMQIGIDYAISQGAKVALLAPACQRPVKAAGAGVPPLAERRDDNRSKHIGELMEKLAEKDPSNVFFIENAPEWCNDDSIAENAAYRWDGTHVTGKGAKLIMDAITDDLLKIPLD